MQGGLPDDHSSSDISPHISTPNSSSRESPTNAPTNYPPVVAPHPSSNTLPGSRTTGPPVAGKKSVGWEDDDHLVDPSHYADENEEEDFDAWDDFDDDNAHEMADRSSMHHVDTNGKSSLPLLGGKEGTRGRSEYESPAGSARPLHHSRRSTFRSRSPDYQAAVVTKKRYTYAAFFLGLSLVTFVIQTETAVYIQHTLKWNKAYCMLWLTHGSWSLLWPATLAILRMQQRKVPWDTFWRRHTYILRTTGQMVHSQHPHLSPKDAQVSPIPYILKTTAFVTTALTIAGGSWYIAVDLTTASDLTAIYNCSAFFAYAFSIPLLGDKLRWGKVLSVGVAILGVLIVAYGDSAGAKHGTKSGGSLPGPSGTAGDSPEDVEASNRTLGNVIIGIGSVLYGLYEVLYKKLACPPEGTSPGRGMLFALTFGSLIGSFTFLVLWIPLPILHFTGLEVFELPRGEAAWMLAISVLMNAVFSGSFLVLISLTSPVLSSVAALLTIFLVVIVDWALPGGKRLSVAAITGGILIIAAFLLLSWSTYREMEEKRRKAEEDEASDMDEEDA